MLLEGDSPTAGCGGRSVTDERGGRGVQWGVTSHLLSAARKAGGPSFRDGGRLRGVTQTVQPAVALVDWGGGQLASLSASMPGREKGEQMSSPASLGGTGVSHAQMTELGHKRD